MKSFRFASIPALVLFGSALFFLVPQEEAPAQAKSKKTPPEKKTDKLIQLRNKLSAPITLDKGIEKGPLKDALEFLTSQTGIEFVIDDKAFNDDLGIKEVEQQEVRLPKMSRIKLASVLKLLLQQVQGTYIIRPDRVEITTAQHAQASLAFDPGSTPKYLRRVLNPVYAKFENRPLDEALNELAETSETTIILDVARAADQGKTTITANFNNVPVDTAVEILANLAKLKMVMLDKALYVTTDENAQGLEMMERYKWEPQEGDPPPPPKEKDHKKG